MINDQSLMSVYLDHHASTPVLPEVWEAMRSVHSGTLGNPSSAHAFGRKARRALEDARECVALLLGAFPDEVIFTSGATEANNLALFGLAGESPGHILASPIEHPCVIEPLKQLAARGHEVEWLPVPSNGSVAVEVVQEFIRPTTRLIALMLVNHETGAIQPVTQVALRAPLHADAAQGVGKIPVSFRGLNTVSLSASGHKFGAPVGIGLLLLKRGTTLQSLFFGGHQQNGRRPGTEPVALAVGLAKALEIAIGRMSQSHAHVARLRTLLLARLQTGAAPITVNNPEDGSPYVANISFPGCRADLLLMKLDLAGIACSTGSACSSGSLLPSPVLQAMQVPNDVLRSAMRLSFAANLSESDIEFAAERIANSANELRRDK
jgi:cysteine desulfurase